MKPMPLANLRTALLILNAVFWTGVSTAEEIRLENKKLSMTFRTEDGSLSSITNRVVRTNYIVEGVKPSFPFVVQLKEIGWGPRRLTLSGGICVF